jgi:catechol 2,3-dioxygenase-like lactoylglutathione lyase family enzyme
MLRPLRWCAAVFCSSLVALPLHAAWAQVAPTPVVRSVGFTVANLDREVAFFTTVLSFRVLSETTLSGDGFEHISGIFGASAREATLALGDERLELTEYLAPRGRPFPSDAAANDKTFQHIAIVVSDMPKAFERLQKNHVAFASTGPQRLPDWNPNAGGIQAFYFRDPEGHFLEILAFPPGKGDPKWHNDVDGRLFLGIDHTAIVTADTDRDLALYRDVLGLRIAGTSENYGSEQEHINNVFGARLRITTLRAPSGPGIELLEYISPPGGRPAAADTRANDLVHWVVHLDTTAIESLDGLLRTRHVQYVSPGIVTLDVRNGPSRALSIVDPDGHALELDQR